MGMLAFRHWWALVLRGVLTLLFGLVALLWPGLTLETLVICFGVLALAGGIAAIVIAAGDRGMHDRWGVLLAEGLVSIVAGLLTFFWPFVTALVLLYLIAAWAIVTGVLELAVAARIHHTMSSWWLLVAAGLASLLFGLLLAMLPGVGLLALTWLIGIYALACGILLMLLGFQHRHLERWLALR